MEIFSTRATHAVYLLVLALLLMSLAGVQGAADLGVRAATVQAFLNVASVTFVASLVLVVGALLVLIRSAKVTPAVRLALISLGASYLSLWSLGAATTRLRLESQMRLQVGDGFVFVGGMISPTLPTDLERLVHPSLRVNQLRLSSVGGDVEAAIQAGEWMEARGLRRVVIEGDCASACAILALILPERYLAPGGALGFHDLNAPIKGRWSAQATREALFARLAERGIPPRVMVPLLQGREMNFPSRIELLSAGLVTGCWSPEMNAPAPCDGGDKTN